MISCGIAKVTKLNKQKSNDYDKGRLTTIDMQSFNASLKMKWVHSYLNTENKGKWKVFFQLLLGEIRRDITVLVRFKTKRCITAENKRPFLKEIVEYWSNLNNSKKNPVSGITH